MGAAPLACLLACLSGGVSTCCLFGNARTNAAIFLIAYVCASQSDNEPTTRAQAAAAAVGDSEKVGASEQA